MSKSAKNSKKKINNMVNDGAIDHLQLIKPNETDIIVAYVDSLDSVSSVLKALEQAFPKNTVLALPRIVSLVELTVKELEMYRKYINKAIENRRKVADDCR